ncbi:MAG: hypothetical protein HN952_07430 [Candidatus Cloacimonetes bacterium]|jgi:uncharacterized protein|nr:hypothetical protein [Candidatus Cloacimonadota bacterium]MBT6994766.1 hypothetical protein [Candidatus Cloacimonadota bacterium]MBT7469464.1 hypothetical protein [Candidatus Cloacimonadota bacterium]
MKKILVLLMVISAIVLVAEDVTVKADTTNVQIIEMEVDRHGWTPNEFTIKVGIPVKWKIDGKELTYCNNAISVPAYKLKFDLKEGEQIIEFTPEKVGEIEWSCWMDMIPGKFIVVDENTSKQIEKKTTTRPRKKSCCSTK